MGPCLSIGAGVSALTLLLAGDTIALPQLLSARAANVDIVLLLSAAYAPLTARCFGGDALRMEATARRSLVGADAVLLIALLAPVAIIAAIGAATNDANFGLDVVRNFAIFVAAALLLLTFAGPVTASTMPVVYLLVISLAGVNADGSSPWWALLRQPATALMAALGVCVVAGALAAFHRWARHRPGMEVADIA